LRRGDGRTAGNTPLSFGEIGPTGLRIQLMSIEAKRAQEHAQGKIVLKAV
jgi:hypothetical protein